MQHLLVLILFAVLGMALSCLNTTKKTSILRPSYWVALVSASALYLIGRLM